MTQNVFVDLHYQNDFHPLTMKIYTGSSCVRTSTLTHELAGPVKLLRLLVLTSVCLVPCLSTMERKVAREFRHKVRHRHFNCLDTSNILIKKLVLYLAVPQV